MPNRNGELSNRQPLPATPHPHKGWGFLGERRKDKPAARKTETQKNMETIKAILALIILILTLIVGIWMDNHLPGFNPVETRMHP